MAARKVRKATAAKSGSQPPPKEVPIRYEHAADYRHFSSTGSLVRAERNVIVVTHYIDEMIPTRQVARLESAEAEGGPEYRLDDIEEEARRLVVAAVRLDPEQAASLAALIAEKVHSIRPDLFPDAKTGGKKK